MDRIKNLEISKDNAVDARDKIGPNPEIYIQNYIEESVNHFSGELVRIKVEYIPDPVTNAILYDFAGKDIKVKKNSDGIDITDAINDMEESDGKDFLLEQLQSAIGVNEFVEKICYEPHVPGDVLLLTGVGEVFPFMRVHNLLEALQPHFSDIPILVMYPGVFDGHHLKLFDKLQPNDYYRAFNII